MALKAGRVGVAPDQVDEFGKINSEATEGYTKQEADAKFETQTNASTEYAKLQPKTLAVPIEMLSGSKLTVESALQGLNNDKVDNNAKVVQTVTHKGIAVSYTRHANIVMVSISGECTEEIANNEIISDVPVGFETTFSAYYNIICFNNISNPSSPILVEGIEGGVVKCNNVIHVGDKPRGTITYGV